MPQPVTYTSVFTLTTQEKNQLSNILTVFEVRIPPLLEYWDLLTKEQKAAFKVRCPLVARLLALFGR